MFRPVAPRFLPVIIGLSLFASACQHHDPAPPSLLGRWEAKESVGLQYSATGQFLSRTVAPNNNYYMVVTQDSIKFFGKADNASWGQGKYTQTDNVLDYGQQADCTITTLTEHTLILHYDMSKKRAPDLPYYNIDDTYTR